MKTLFYIILGMCAAGAMADAQINQAENFAHVPYDSADTDREFFVSNIKTAVIQDGDQSVMAIESRRVLCGNMPPEFDVNLVGDTVTVSSGDTDDLCAVTDVNGARSLSDNWSASARVEKACNSGNSMVLKFTISCKQAQTQE